MDIDKVTHGISQNGLAWMRELARDDSSPSDDDSQDVHVSDAEVMFDTITASFVKSSMCPRVNSHESVSLVLEGNIMGRGQRVTIFNGSSAQLGTLSQPFDIPVASIMADGVARVDAVTLDLKENSRTVPIQLTLYGLEANRDRCKTILSANAAFRTVTEENAGNIVAQEQRIPTGVTTYVPNNGSGHAASPFAGLDDDPYLQVGSHRQKLTLVEAVRTPLFPHQKQALHWMMSRENDDHLPPFWEKMPSGHYYNRLLKHTADERPPSIRGGILADDMGLGKTLVIISLILTNFVDNRQLAVPVPGVHRLRGEKRLQSFHESIAQMDEKDPTKKTPYLTKLRFGNPDSSNIETTGTGTTTLDVISDMGSTPANRSIYSSSTMQREATVTEFGQPTNAKRKFSATETDLVYENERSKQRKLHLDSLPSESGFSAVCNAQSSIHTSGDESVTEEPDVIIVGVSSDIDRRWRCSGNDGRMEDEGGGASDFMKAYHCDEIGRTLSERCDPRGTLIICPLSVLSSWQGQFEEHTNTNIHIDIHRYHGSLRSMDSSFIQSKDVVITTYDIVRSDFKFQRMTSPLFTLNWLRIVLDEGHLIRNPLADQTKAVLALKAQRKWVVTGTPIQNKMLDLSPLVRFLHVTPLDVRSWWDFLNNKQVMIILKRVQHLMDNIAMRREKNTLVDGEPLVNMPKRKVNIERIKMFHEESWGYNFMEKQGEIEKKIHAPVSEAGEKKYMHHEIILRLRQMCCHIDLLPPPWQPHYDAEVKKLVNKLKVVSQSEEECSVCVDVLKTPVILPCAHYFCQRCILDTIKYMEQTNQGNATCPMCRVPISEDQLIELPVQPEPHTYGNWNSSTKVDALMSALVNLKSEDPSIKSLVFSGFTSFLTLIETPLREHNFQFVRLDGKMSASQRRKAICSFSDTKLGSPTIFLISLRAGGVGLNLTAASRVFLMEPQWNPAAEEQCFDRCHRLGQTKDVIITKFISADTIEEYILKVQERKRMMMQQAFKKQPTATERT